MPNDDELLIRPYKVERVCSPHPNIDQLVLKEIDMTESVYSRALVKLKDASLPAAIVYDSIEQMTLSYITWDLFLALKYRQDWRPTGYGLGELLYSISLLPNEELTLEVKTWETSKTQQDETLSVEAKNVSDIKSTSSSTNEVTTEYQTKTHEYVDAKASYSGFGFNVSCAAGWAQDVNDMQKNFGKWTQDNSRQVTNEYRSTRKVQIALSRETGSEDKTTRKIKNINQAHTLNANYYELLREYELGLDLYDVALVLLGDEPQLTSVQLGASKGTYKVWPSMPGLRCRDDDPSKPMLDESLSLGRVIQLSHSGTWVQAFTDRYGVSPIKLLREMWSAPLYDSAMVEADWGSGNAQITDEQRKAFQSTMLQYVQPSPGWVEPDQNAALRWGYEIIPGLEDQALMYLYKFVPYSAAQMIARALSGGVEHEVAYEAIGAKYVAASIAGPLRKPSVSSLEAGTAARTTAATVQVHDTDKILIPGPFHGWSFEDFKLRIPDWVKSIINQFQGLERGPIKVDGKDTWTTTLPTQGVYSDLALGICSGAEDYYEIQRQFDLELKRAEIEKLKLEVAKLELEKQFMEQGKPESSVLIKNPTDNVAISLGVNASNTSTQVEIQKEP